MKIHQINEKISKINLDGETKSSILELIDQKIECDMDKVLNKMEVLDKSISGIKSEIKVVYWVIGIVLSFIGIVIALTKVF